MDIIFLLGELKKIYLFSGKKSMIALYLHFLVVLTGTYWIYQTETEMVTRASTENTSQYLQHIASRKVMLRTQPDVKYMATHWNLPRYAMERPLQPSSLTVTKLGGQLERIFAQQRMFRNCHSPSMKLTMFSLVIASALERA